MNPIEIMLIGGVVLGTIARQVYLISDTHWIDCLR